MLEKIRKLHIKSQFIFILVLIFISMYIVTLIFYRNIVNIYEERNTEYTADLMNQITRNVSRNCNIIDNMLINIAYSDLTQEYLTQTDQSLRFENYTQLDNFAQNMQEMNDSIIDIVIIGNNNNNNYQINNGISIGKKLVDKLPKRADSYYSPLVSLDTDSYERYKTDVFFVGINIYSIDSGAANYNIIGSLFIVVDKSLLFDEEYSSSKELGTQIFFTDRTGHLFSNTNETISNSFEKDLSSYLLTNDKSNNITIDEHDYYISTETVEEIQGNIISITPRDKMLQKINQTRTLQILLFIISLIVLLIPFTVVANNIIHPLNVMTKFMNKVIKGDLRQLKSRLHIEGYSEMSLLAEKFNVMLDEINLLTKRLIESNTNLYELELEKKQSELAYLRSQINPHFLYNTLESIKGLAAEANVPQITKITSALGRVFRYSIKGSDIVSLSYELNIVKSYLEIQQIRFENRFDVVYDISDSTIECQIPKMILQPLVENAIFYGLETKLEKGLLKISSTIIDKNLVINIIDNGPGIKESKLQDIKKNLNIYNKSDAKSYSSDKGIGIINVNNRVKLAYGNKYGLKVESENQKGTKVSVILPVIIKSKEKN